MPGKAMTFQRSSPARAERGGILVRLLVACFLFGGLMVSLVVFGLYKMVSLSPHSSFPAAKPAAKRMDKPMAKSEPCPTLDAAQAADLVKGQAASIIPIKPGLLLENIWYIPGHDFEILNTISSVTREQVTSTSTGQGVSWKNGQIDRIYPSGPKVPHLVCQADLADGRVLVTENGIPMPQVIRGITHFSLSRLIFASLKSGQPTLLGFRQDYFPIDGGYSWQTDLRGSFRMDGPSKFHVLVNDSETDLPAMSASGDLGGNRSSLVVLDDPANPLLLDFQIPAKEFRAKITKISFPVEKKLEKELAENGRAEVYGIYFDFDNAQLRPESDTVLAEISQALKGNADWKLSIEGHTDNVGGDKHNLELSQRRAESVKTALVDRYQVSPDRLVTAGFGASQPKATNETVEGRALNRRVELVRK
jgi:outer membrane protein OmpA-like peptidoglycan-associated protein